MRITRLIAGTVSAGLLGVTPLAIQAPAHADGQTYTPVVNVKLNISDSPYEAPYMAGGGFYVSGDITDPSGVEHPSGGQALLQVSTASNPTWTTIATDDSPGFLFFDANLTFTENAQYKVVFTGSTAQSAYDDSYVAGESVAIAAPVTRKVKIGNPKGTVLKGKITPGYGKSPIKVQKKVGKKWKKFRTFKTDKKGGFRFSLPAPSRGKWVWKVTVPGNKKYTAWTNAYTTYR